MDSSTHYNNTNGEQAQDTTISVEQVKRLVQLLDRSDVSEIELKQASEGVHLVLRKAKAPVSATVSTSEMFSITAPLATNGSFEEAAPVETKHIVVAPLVGIFHTWGKPNGKALVAVGDRIKLGQLVGTIQSLNVINEVESAVAGHIVEIFVRDGQPVEYGQQLMAIDSAERA